MTIRAPTPSRWDKQHCAHAQQRRNPARAGYAALCACAKIPQPRQGGVSALLYHARRRKVALWGRVNPAPGADSRGTKVFVNPGGPRPGGNVLAKYYFLTFTKTKLFTFTKTSLEKPSYAVHPNQHSLPHGLGPENARFDPHMDHIWSM